MTMEHPGRSELEPFCNQLALQFRNLYYGVNPGRWKSCFPVNRLIFILDSDGESSFTDATRKLVLRSGMRVLVPAFHEITHDQNETMLHLSIHFNLELYRSFDAFSRYHALFDDLTEEACSRARELAAETDRFRMAAKLFHLSWETFDAVLDRTGDSFEELLAGCSRYQPLLEYLAAHCHAGIEVGEMADVMHMNRETFIKKFIYDTGFPPKRFFNRLLVARAANLLISSDLAVREVADELHFCNEFYFSRFFRRHTGTSPSTFRKRYAGHPDHWLVTQSLPSLFRGE